MGAKKSRKRLPDAIKIKALDESVLGYSFPIAAILHHFPQKDYLAAVL